MKIGQKARKREMTNKAALEILEISLKVYKAMADDVSGKLFVEAFEHAIDALKEKIESEDKG